MNESFNSTVKYAIKRLLKESRNAFNFPLVCVAYTTVKAIARSVRTALEPVNLKQNSSKT